MKYGTLFAVLALGGTAVAQPGADPATGHEPGALDPGAHDPGAHDPGAHDTGAQPAMPHAPAPTRATFVSTSEDQWDVSVDRQPACSTPCSLELYPMQFIALRSQERSPVRLDVGYLPQGDLIVTGKPLANGMYAGGIVMTSFAGMAVVTGITLTAVGCSTDRDGMCTAGLITGVAGAVGLYGGIYLMRRALPRYSVGPASPYVAHNQVGLTGRF
jgi:hypothetical protein